MRLGAALVVASVSFAFVLPPADGAALVVWFFVPPASNETPGPTPGQHAEHEPSTIWIESAGTRPFVNVLPVTTPLTLTKTGAFKLFLDDREAFDGGKVHTIIRILVADEEGGIVLAQKEFVFSQVFRLPTKRVAAPNWTNFVLDARSGTGLVETASTVTVPAGRTLLVEVRTNTENMLGEAGALVATTDETYNSQTTLLDGHVGTAFGIAEEGFADACSTDPRCPTYERLVNGTLENTTRKTLLGLAQGVGALGAAAIDGTAVPIGHFRLATPAHPTRLEARVV